VDVVAGDLDHVRGDNAADAARVAEVAIVGSADRGEDQRSGRMSKRCRKMVVIP